jgi:glycosyltransferase involved in cell wall biosynthesis
MIADKYPDWHIDIYGEGEEKAYIEKLIQNCHLTKRVKLFAPSSHIYDEYRNSQFLVLSSDSESFSLVIVEAMACGLPVVSTDCPFGPRDIIEDGKTGLLSRLDSEDLAAKMEWMIIHTKEREDMGKYAHQAAARYKKDVVMKEWEHAYLSVL